MDDPDFEAGPRPGGVVPNPEDTCTRASLDGPCTCPNGLDPDAGSRDPDAGCRDPMWMSWTNTSLALDSCSAPVEVFDPTNGFSDSFPDGAQAESIDLNFNGNVNSDGSFT